MLMKSRIIRLLVNGLKLSHLVYDLKDFEIGKHIQLSSDEIKVVLVKNFVG